MLFGRRGRKLYSRAGSRGGIDPGRPRSSHRLAAEARLEQRAAEKIEMARLGPAYRREQSETGHISLVTAGHALHVGVEKLMLGIGHIENIHRSDESRFSDE